MTFNFRKCVAAMLTISMLAMSLPAPSWARIVPTDARSQDHDRVEQMLVQSGVAPDQAKSRVAALTDEEAVRVAAEFDAMPAGAGGGGGELAGAVVIALLLSVDPGAAVVLGVGLLLLVFASSHSGRAPNSDRAHATKD